VFFLLVVAALTVAFIYAISRTGMYLQEEIYVAASFHEYLLFLIIPLFCLITLYIFSIFSREAAKYYIFCFTVSIFGAFYAAELYYFVTDKGDYHDPRRHGLKQAAKELGVPFDERNFNEVLSDLRRDHPSLLINYSQSALAKIPPSGIDGIQSPTGLIRPLGNVSNSRILACNESGEWITMDNDEHGFNNPRGLFAKDSIDILLVGDSFTQGYCVKQDETIAGHLRKLGLNVISLGIGGNGPLTALASIAEYARYLRPKFVIYNYFEKNDLIDLGSLERKSEILLSYLNPNFLQRLYERQDEIDTILLTFLKRIERINVQRQEQARLEARRTKTFRESEFFKWMKLTRLRGKLIGGWPGAPEQWNPYTFEPDLDLFRRAIQASKERSEKVGARYFVAYLPEWDRYGYDRVDDKALYHRGDVLEILQDLDVPVIDFLNRIKAFPDPLAIFPFRKDAHYNSTGYGELADQIFTVITEQQKKQ
tara:strand:- start:1219 stop:2661 length:1443 start_codon:yes stop_codon:yes gene_type:complete